MVLFLRIDKDANIKEEDIKDIENLYKSCGLRKKEGFVKLFECDIDDYQIQLWGRNNGRNNIKNKLVFPLDNNLTLFGTIAIVCLCNNNLQDLTIDKWNELCKNFKKDNVINKYNIEYKSDSKSDSKSDIKSDNKSDSKSDSKNDNKNDSDDESISEKDSSDDESSNSELQSEEYIYSSEEEN